MTSRRRIYPASLAALERMEAVPATNPDRFALREAPLAFDWKPAL
ncbi:MAG TPA: hypothetical protein VF619_01825 [Allosphingosinicella sp.]|jgi:hypothetical protein